MKISRRKLFGGLIALPVLGLLGRESSKVPSLKDYVVANKPVHAVSSSLGSTKLNAATITITRWNYYIFALDDNEYVRADGTPYLHRDS